MATAQQSPYITEEEYLALDGSSEDMRYEYANGEIIAMTGGSPEHTDIISYTTFALIRELGVDGCRVSASEQRVKVEGAHSCRYPDIAVVCDDPEYQEDKSGVKSLTNPTVLFEVLSTSTSATDTFEKVQEYRLIASLKAYIIIAQNKPYVQVYQRSDDNQWVLSDFSGLDKTITIAALGIDLALSDIYARITFDTDTDTSLSDA